MNGTLKIALPAPETLAEFYHPYLKAVGQADVVDLLRRQIEELDTLMKPLSDRQGLGRYAAGKWSIKEVVGHLSDAERVFGYRLLRVSRLDKTPLPGFDENHYVDHGGADRRTLVSLVQEFIYLRRANLLLIDSLESTVLDESTPANGRPVSVRALIFILAGHVAHHLGVLRDRYAL